MIVDYVIVGQGICGSFLSWNLLKSGKSVLVIDEPRSNSSTKVASGVINPVTGRRIVKTWMIDELLPFAHSQYKALGEDLDEELVRQCNILQFHSTSQMKDAFIERQQEEADYLKTTHESKWKDYFNFIYGVGEIDPCLLINLNLLLDKWRKILQKRNALLEEKFELQHFRFTDKSITYKDITAQKIIFCNGADAFELPFFQLLPFAKNKGEAIIAEIPGLPPNNIYKQAFSIVPWQHNLFWIGSSYQWTFENDEPTEAFRIKILQALDFWLKLPYKIVDHIAAERPATLERRPFVGLHPQQPSIGMLNGMGTKGCSLAPYFAHQLAEHLVNGSPINADADVQRFKRILSRQNG